MFEINEIEELENQVNLSILYKIAKNSAQIGNEILKLITIIFRKYHQRVGRVILLRM